MQDLRPPQITFKPSGTTRVDLGAGLSGPFAIEVVAQVGNRYRLTQAGKPPGSPSDWAELEEYPWGPYDLEGTLFWIESMRRYQLVRLQSRDPHAFDSDTETGITAVGLRAIRVGRLTYDIARRLLELRMVDLPDDDADRVTRAVRAAICARAFGANSQDFVADNLGVSRSTAKRLLATARAQGNFDG